MVVLVWGIILYIYESIIIFINNIVKIVFIVIKVLIVFLGVGFLKFVIVLDIVFIFVSDDVLDENVFKSKNNVILGIVLFIVEWICGVICLVVMWNVLMIIKIIKFIINK